MPLPSVEQYSIVIDKRDPLFLSTLTRYDFLFKENGSKKEYCFSKGESAAVFKAVKGSKSFAMRSFLKGEPETKVVKGLKSFAIRCFLRPHPETFNRYQQIAAFISTKALPWKVGFEFLDNEILIDDQYYPVLKMDWEDGIPINQFIDDNANNDAQLSKLQKKLVALSQNLEENGIGHGNLEYSNILVNEQQDVLLKLIDYDSMFIPAFRGEKSLETGNRGFQPPERTLLHFSETIDRFSIWVMLTTLEAVKINADIWKHMQQGGYNREHSFFSASDFFNPDMSPIFQKLRTYNSEALNFYLDRLIAFSRTSNLDAIEKPALYKSSLIFPSHEISKPTPTAPAIVVEQPRQYEVEIKTIPSGKDVFVYGSKKGITPLRLSLLKKDFDHVEVANDSEKTLVPINEKNTVYEIDFPKKETIPPPPPVEQDEILEFRADKYNIEEGELTTINWNVKGQGKIHITNLGEVAEKRGTQKVVLNHTTNYVLTVGSKNRSLTINVQPRPKPVIIQPPAPVQEKPATIVEEEKPAASSVETKRRSKNTPLKIVIALAALVTVSFFAFNYFSGKKTNAVFNSISTNAMPVEMPLFTASSVTSFLNSLYNSYNNRNFNSIMSNYAGSVNEYYDSKEVSKDSLSSIVKNLFITPAYYSCKPDFKTLTVQPQGKNCKAVITIHEKLRNNSSSKTENYTTTIEYLLDPSYKIISEKSL
jgi:hypothetical protein